jgi:hypothetical protein
MSAHKRIFSPAVIALLALVAFWAIFFFEVVLRNKYFMFGDIAYLSLPAHKMLAEALRHLRLPLWSPQIFGGFPLLAEGQVGAFYPLTLFFHTFLANEYALSLLVVVHFFMAGLFTYLYARQLGMEEAAALLSSLVYAFGAFFTTHLMQTSVIFSATWLALGLYLLEKYFLERKRIYFLWLGLVCALQILAGNLPVFWFSLWAYILYFAWFWSKEKLPAKEIGYFLGSMVLGLGLAAMQLVPYRELVLNATRSMAYNNGAATFPLVNIITYLFPNFFGLQTPTNDFFYYGQYHYWDLACYIGVAPLILVLVALVFRITKHMNYFILLFIGSLALSLGNYPQGITGFLFLENFSLAILAGLGLKILLLKKENFSLVLKRIYVWIGKFLLLLFGGGYILILLGKDRLAKAAYLLGSGSLVNLGLWADKLVGGLQYSLNIINIHLYVQLILLFLIYWVIKGFLFGEIKTRAFQIIVIALLMFDLYYFGASYNATTDTEQIMPSVRLLNVLRQDPSYFRIYNHQVPRSYEVLGPQYTLIPNLNMLWNLDEIGGYMPWELNPIARVSRDMAARDVRSDLLYLGKLNVKYILNTEPLRSPGLKEVFKDARIHVYENLFFRERAYFLKNSGSLPVITVYQNNEVKILASNSLPDTLVLSDVYYPGWRVWVDGQAGEVGEYDNLFRQVAVPAGKHEIIFKYQPLSLKIGWLISLAAWAIFLSLLAGNFIKRKKTI